MTVIGYVGNPNLSSIGNPQLLSNLTAIDLNQPSTVDGEVRRVRFGAATASGSNYIQIWRLVESNFVLQSEINIIVPSGNNWVDLPTPMEISIGDHIGVFTGTSSNIRVNGGPAEQYESAFSHVSSVPSGTPTTNSPCIYGEIHEVSPAVIGGDVRVDTIENCQVESIKNSREERN